MKTQTSLPLACILASILSSVGCGSSSTDELRDPQSQSLDIIRNEECECGLDDDVHASPAECIAYGPGWGISNAVYACRRLGYAAVPAAEVRDLCTAAKYERYAECVLAAACDWDVIDECYDEHVYTAEPCPSLTDQDRDRYAEVVHECIGGTPRGCLDGDASGAVGSRVFSGTTIGAGHDHDAGSGPDVWHQWTAPGSGPYVIDVAGTEFRAVIRVSTACEEGDQLGVSYPNDSGYTEPLEFIAEAGTRYIIVIDSDESDEDAGEYVINIR